MSVSNVHDLETGLVAYWPLGDIQGTSVPDIIGSNTGTATSMTEANIVPGQNQYRNALNLDGSADMISVSDSADLGTGDIDFTLCAWVNADSLGANMMIAGKYNTNNSNREYRIFYDNGASRFEINVTHNGINVVKAQADTLGAPSVGIWYFIIVWHDATLNTINIQVDNRGFDSTAHSVGVFDGVADFTIGSGPEPGGYFDGKIQDVLFTKRVLTGLERELLYKRMKRGLKI